MKKSVHAMIDNWLQSLVLFSTGAWIGPGAVEKVVEVVRAVIAFVGG